jgi:hypothetical protein
MHRDAQDALAKVISAADEIGGIARFTGRTEPDVKT